MAAVRDLIVVGGGILGAAVALEATRAGMSTILVEAASPGSGVTAAGMGHVVVMDDSPAQLALSSYSRQLWLEESPLLENNVEYQSTGTIWVAADEEEMEECHKKGASYASAGVAASVLSPAELAEAEPNLRAGLAGGLLVPGDGVCYPPAAASHFLRQAVRMGAMHRCARVAAAGHGQVCCADGSQLSAAAIVLATGADLSLLPRLPIYLRKGHLVITDRYPGFARHQLLELGYLKSAHGNATESVAFNIQPRRTGQMLIGSSRQSGSRSPEAEYAMVGRMLRRAAEYMPALDTLSALRVWTGFRAATADKLPLIGPVAPFADDPTLHLAMGFEGLGITNAPGAAKLVVDNLLGRPSAIDPKPFLPERLVRTPELAHA